MHSSNILSTIWQLLHVLLQEVTPELDEFGLSTRGFLLLSKIDDYPYPGELSKELFLPPSTVTLITKQLEKRDFLMRKHCKEDLRCYQFVLTAKGKQILKKGNDVLVKRLGERMRSLTASEQKQLTKILDKLIS